MPSKLRATEALAITRARHGLIRHRNGWATDSQAIDARDLLQFRTINTLARKGLLAMSEDGQRASLATPCCA